MINSIGMQVLSPVRLTEKQQQELHFKTYEDALDAVFEKREKDGAEVLNIALSGTYGAGKSSIMKTYEALRPDKKMIHVSFAHFECEEPKDKTYLQTKIVNQMIHQIAAEDIMESNLKLKVPVEKKTIKTYTVMLSIMLLSLLYLILCSEYIWKYYFFEGQKYVKISFNVLAIILICVCTAYFTGRIISRQMHRPLIKSLSIDKNVIDFAETQSDREDSLFDKYMDEIIYLIRHGRLDAIVFEDMDRFDNVEIFNELRELNFLVNHKREKIEGEEAGVDVKFFYLIRDDLFGNPADRTKFFDLIIPVVPVMSKGNSFELLCEILKENGIDLEGGKSKGSDRKQLKTSYLKKLCIYIPDYRLLKNICNEFFVFCRQLEAEKSTFDLTRIFAMITYKNLFPEDYDALSRKTGYVYNLLQLRPRMIKKQEQQIETEIIGQKEKIKQMRNEFAESEEELQALYLSGNSKYKSTAGYYIVDGIPESGFENRIVFIREMKEAESLQFKSVNYSTPFDVSIEDVLNDLEKNQEYAERLKWLKEKSEGGIERANQSIAELEQAKSMLKDLTIPEIKERYHISLEQIWKDNITEEISERDIAQKSKKYELARILVEDGMITLKDYEYYMSYFYPGSLTKEELAFLNRVYADMELTQEERETILEHPAEIMEHMERMNYASRGIRNNFFMNYLLESGESEKARWIIRGIAGDNDLDYAYMLRNCVTRKREYMMLLLNEWENFWEKLDEESGKSESEKMDILIDILLNCGEENSIGEELKNTMFRFLRENETLFKQIPFSKNKSALALLQREGYEFQFIQSDEGGEVERFIYENNMYKINRENIERIFDTFFENETKDYNAYNYRNIKELNDKHLYEYISGNLQEYAMVYETCYLENSEEKDVVILFLNDDDIEMEWKEQFVEKLPEKLKIGDLSEIVSQQMQEKVVKAAAMLFNAQNILEYWSWEENIDDALEHFLKVNYQKSGCDLTFGAMCTYYADNEHKDDVVDSLLRQLLAIRYPGRGYQNLVSSLNVWMGKFPFETVPEGMMEFMVSQNIVRISRNNLKVMRESYSGYIIDWITAQQDSYVKYLRANRDMIREEELHSIITKKDVGITESTKLGLIGLCEEKLPIHSYYRSAEVEAIIDRGLFDGQFRGVFDKYESKCGKATRGKIYELTVSNIEQLLNFLGRIPDTIWEKLLDEKRVGVSMKKRLLANQLRWREGDIEALRRDLQRIGATEYLPMFEGQKPKIEETVQDKILLDALVANKIIASYSDRGEYYVINPRRHIE